MRQSLEQDARLEVNSVLLSTSAAVAGKQPAGLLNSVTPITATTGGGAVALAGDLGGLANAVPNAADLVLIMNEAERVRAVTLAPGVAVSVPIITSTVLPARTIVALDTGDFFSGAADDLDISSSIESTIVSRSDPTPQVSAAGVAGKPTISAYQEDLLRNSVAAKLDVGHGDVRPDRDDQQRNLVNRAGATAKTGNGVLAVSRFRRRRPFGRGVLDRIHWRARPPNPDPSFAAHSVAWGAASVGRAGASETPVRLPLSLSRRGRNRALGFNYGLIRSGDQTPCFTRRCASTPCSL